MFKIDIYSMIKDIIKFLKRKEEYLEIRYKSCHGGYEEVKVDGIGKTYYTASKIVQDVNGYKIFSNPTRTIPIYQTIWIKSK